VLNRKVSVTINNVSQYKFSDLHVWSTIITGIVNVHALSKTMQLPCQLPTKAAFLDVEESETGNGEGSLRRTGNSGSSLRRTGNDEACLLRTACAVVKHHQSAETYTLTHLRKENTNRTDRKCPSD